MLGVFEKHLYRKSDFFSIDNVIIEKKINNQFKICIDGWYFSVLARKDGFLLMINGESRDFSFQPIARSDVQQVYYKVLADDHVGFHIEAVITERDLSRIVLMTMDRIILLDMDSKKIKKKVIIPPNISYSIDICQPDVIGNISVEGWAVSMRCDHADLQVFTRKGKAPVSIEVKRKTRPDLPFDTGKRENAGFSLDFNPDGHKISDFDLVISDQYIQHCIHLKPCHPQKKAHLLALNRQNLSNGIAYFKKHGFKKTIARIAELSKQDHFDYDNWYRKNRTDEQELATQRTHQFDYAPKISFIVPCFNTRSDFLSEMINSVKNQSYSNWELCLADASTTDSVEAFVKSNCQNDSRIKYVRLEKNYGISGNTNEAMKLATGDYIALLDHDDLIEPDSLYEIVSVLQDRQYDVIYSDEDKYDDETKKYFDPHFKPDFNIDLLRSENYITHLFVAKSSLIRQFQFSDKYDGAQDLDMILRCTEQANGIYHISKALYHWRSHMLSTAKNPESKKYCHVAGQNAIQDHLDRMKIDAHVEMMPLFCRYHVIYQMQSRPLVSIIIPNKDEAESLKKCIDSLFHINTYQEFEIIIVENNSESKEIFDYYKELSRFDNIKVVTYEGSFNYSKINNYGVTFAKGDYVLLLNNDTEVINPDAIYELLSNCQRADVGIVGAKLLYYDNTVQHAGVIIGLGGIAGHAFTGLSDDDPGYFARAAVSCDYSAVTAACMMTKRSVFEQVGGFEEKLRVAFNDVDYCLKVRQLGLLVVYDAFSKWHHYESKSRGIDASPEKKKRFEEEVDFILKKWSDILTHGDPYYNKNLSLTAVNQYTVDGSK